MISIHQGSILDSKADFIVNPANSFLRHDGGLAKVIAEAACGPKAVNPGMDEREWFGRERLTDVAAAWQQEQRDVPLIATGNAHMTSAGVLSHKGIIHAVGPIWNGGNYYEQELLESAYFEALRLADIHGTSIAFPAISAGVFGMPIETVANIGMNAAWNMRRGPHIEFWLFSDEHYDAFADEGVLYGDDIELLGKS